MTAPLHHGPASAIVFGSLLWVSCAKKAPEVQHLPLAVAPAVDTETLIRQVGAEPGPVRRSEGSVAVIADSVGAIEVRRLGQEVFLPIRNGVLYPGDQVRVLADARATVMFADMSSVEIAEQSSLGIGSRFGSLDPASSASVLSGVARFTVTPRVPGEGPFVVYTAAGIVAAKGTVFTVGAFASGVVRVGVESGAIEVAGASAIARPENVGKDTSIELSAEGELGAKTAWPRDDWGAVRMRSDRDADLEQAATVHGNGLADLTRDLAVSYESLRKTADELAAFELAAANARDENAEDAYRELARTASPIIETVFLTGLRIEWLTHAYRAHAQLAAELCARHPKQLRWSDYASRVDAAVLWAKRHEGAVLAVLEPARVSYYLHHPRGRTNAPFVGLTIPEFFAKLAPAEGKERPKLAFEVYVPPRPAAMNDAHGLWMVAPTPGWYAQARAHPAPMRGTVAFWSPPTEVSAKSLFGVAPALELPTRFGARPSVAKATLRGSWSTELGTKIETAPPHPGYARSARAAFIAGMPLPAVRAPVREVAMEEVEEPAPEAGKKRKERDLARAERKRSRSERSAQKARSTRDDLANSEPPLADAAGTNESRTPPARATVKADAKVSLDL